VALLNKFKNINTLENDINSDLSLLNEWADKWNMDFNPSKTKMIIFSNKRIRANPNIRLKNEQIEQVTTHKHLGVFLSNDMKWTTHIDYCVKKARKKLGLIRRQSQKLSKKQRVDLYKTMIRPVLEYGSALFDNCSTGDSLKLENCQRTAALICSGAMRRTESTLLLNLLGWESLSDRRKVSKMALFFKIIHNQTAPYLLRNLTFTDSQTYRLRTSDSIKLPRCRLTTYRKSFFPACISIWNKLPKTTTNASNIASFKNEIKNYFKIENKSEKLNPLNHSHDGFFGKILTQIKLKLSPLKDQLFKYNLTENPFCPSCKECLETSLHYFTECPIYDQHREPFFRNLQNMNNQIITSNDFLNFIINGSNIGNHDQRILTNKKIHRLTTIFMYKTGRFTSD
jgi:hypothetical protein